MGLQRAALYGCAGCLLAQGHSAKEIQLVLHPFPFLPKLRPSPRLILKEATFLIGVKTGARRHQSPSFGLEMWKQMGVSERI